MIAAYELRRIEYNLIEMSCHLAEVTLNLPALAG